MSSKQDLVGARTPADIERRYNFSKRFAEVLGVATDAQKAAEDAQKAAGNPAEKLTQEEIFNLLTNNGEAQGIYRENGQIYINASYIMAGVIDAAVVQVVNLVAEKLKSVLEEEHSELNIDGSVLKFLSNGNETIKICNEFEGLPILYMKDFEEGTDTQTSGGELSPHHLKLGGTSISPVFELQTRGGSPDLKIDGTYRRLSWKDNGDGTYTLTGK